MKDGFVKVAAGTPAIRVADCRYNAEQIFTLMRKADEEGVRVLCLPELCLTGATCGDLFCHDALLRGAQEGLATVLEATKNLDMLTVLGLPVRCGEDALVYNCAAVIHAGELLALVPKINLSADQRRWFARPAGARTVVLCGRQVSMDADTVFTCTRMPSLVIGVDLGEDLWAPQAPAARLCVRGGATLMLNLSATCEIVGQAEFRRAMVTGQSARLNCGYVCACAGEGESTTDLVFSGHDLIAEKGELLAQRRFATGLTVSEVDVDYLASLRRREQAVVPGAPVQRLEFSLGLSKTVLTRHVSPTPFVPEDEAECARRCSEILCIAALGLKKRLEHTRVSKAVLGLSGGLDSTLAILTCTLAMKMLGRPVSDIVAVTMPCFGTTDRTRNNAEELASRLGATLMKINIGDAVRQHFKDIGQSMEEHDVTFENAQARERTQVLMDVGNKLNGLVVGTGDLSELALGWATYNGDHMSMYDVNASIPKTLVRHLVSYVAGDKAQEDERLSAVLTDILDTPVSPELLPAVAGKIAQKTEDLVGPYELHDFFLYYAVRRGYPPAKVYRLAVYAMGRRYDAQTVLKWLKNFYRRFFAQQFKRSCCADGPKVGSLTLSPRGDWVMPSDAVAELWLEELETL